ncbi:GH13256 [Drosophila grimshawi]|uniref:GH13256 n=1 Tax=Drosophila grimshawi TaxID=7222 RepID=B4JTZ2_DROGR|nr:GH13256 [Drosophila grimshawi]
MIREYVIAKFEDVWYRARVIRIIQNQLDCTYNVMFLDFTNVAFVTEQDIRRYPADLTVPCFTSVCLIEDMPHRPTTDQINFLEKKLQMNSLLHIDSVNYSPHTDIALIKCDSLIEGLAKMM